MWSRSIRPSPSRSSATTPMLAVAFPSPLKATPAERPTSSNLKPPRLRKRKLGERVVGHEEVEPAVAVEVGDGQAQAPAVGGLDPRLAAHVGEGAVAVVAEEVVLLGGEEGGRAVDRLARMVAARRGRPRVDLDVGDGHEVEVAVAVEVAEAGRGRPPRRGDPGAIGDVLERPVPAVAVEDRPVRAR